MTWIIAKKEITNALRGRAFIVAYAAVFCLVLVATVSGYRQYKQQHQERLAASEETRLQWLKQDPKHPHNAAHFGNFAFMPKTALSLFDVGLDSFTGTAIYLEPHRQNDFSFKPAETRNSSIRFGELSMALVLQVLLPLMIIFIAFASFTSERSGGTLRQLYAQGITFKQLYQGKFVGFGMLALLMLLPVVALLLTAQCFLGITAAIALRIALLALLYAVYLLLFVALSLLVSALCKESKAAILILLVIWIANIIVLPKWAANAGDNLYPLPTKYDFMAAIKADITKGINGHDSRDQRAVKLKQELLQKYGVDTISKLPFNFEGYIMQAGEAYSSLVYDKHFSRLQQTLDKQNQISLWCSLIDPFIATKGISMGLSGTDYYTHLDFQQQAEQYRRSFVQYMNLDMQNHSELGNWDYKVGPEVYRHAPQFSYQQPSIVQNIRPYLAGFCSLLIWSVLIIVTVAIINRQSMQSKL